jgi:hypothetical protein
MGRNWGRQDYFEETDMSVCWVNCSWPSPAQSFLVPSPAGCMSIFHRFTTLGIILTDWDIQVEGLGWYKTQTK